MEGIVAANPEVFRTLARFVAAGHELVLLKGNHDAELHWDMVQDRFGALLVELSGLDAEAGEAFRARVAVHPWFYYHPGVLYVEHGNQYDELCSFEHGLWPVGYDHRIEAPLSHVTLKTFSSVLHRLDPHGIDRWRLRDFLSWLLSLGPELTLRSAGAYLGCAAWLADLKRRLGEGAHQAKAQHLRRLAELVNRFRISLEAVHLLDRLRRRPAGRSILRGFRMLFFDQLLLLLVATGSLGALAVAPIDPRWRAALTGIVALATALLSRAWLRWRRVDADPELAESAERVAAVLGVPLVVFGHSHVPRVTPLPIQGATYVNTGSWTHDGHAGLTHLFVRIEPGGRPSAELLRWNPATAHPDSWAAAR